MVFHNTDDISFHPGNPLLFLFKHDPFADDIVADQDYHLCADLYADARQAKAVDEDQQNGFLDDQCQDSAAEESRCLAEQLLYAVGSGVKYPQAVGDIGEGHCQNPRDQICYQRIHVHDHIAPGEGADADYGGQSSEENVEDNFFVFSVHFH